jgi:hypothetical protein
MSYSELLDAIRGNNVAEFDALLRRGAQIVEESVPVCLAINTHSLPMLRRVLAALRSPVRMVYCGVILWSADAAFPYEPLFDYLVAVAGVHDGSMCWLVGDVDAIRMGWRLRRFALLRADPAYARRFLEPWGPEHGPGLAPAARTTVQTLLLARARCAALARLPDRLFHTLLAAVLVHW